MSTVLVTSRSFSTGSLDVARQLAEAGLAVERAPAHHPVAELRDPLARAVAWIAGTGPVTAEHLALAPHLKVVARYGVGVDAVDLVAAHAHGVVVTNTPGANSEAVADHTIALLLALLRGVVEGDRQVRAGTWRVERARELASLSCGVIGLGRIGRAVARRLTSFGAAVAGIDPGIPDDELRRHGVASGDGVIPARTDVVSLHAPGTGVIVTPDWLAAAKPGLLLVNTARASLVDEEAVAGALRSGTLGGYAADTLSTESAESDAAESSPLLAADLAARVVLTPHSAAQTVEAVDRMGEATTRAVLDVLAGRRPAHLVPTSKGRP